MVICLALEPIIKDRAVSTIMVICLALEPIIKDQVEQQNKIEDAKPAIGFNKKP